MLIVILSDDDTYTYFSGIMFFPWPYTIEKHIILEMFEFAFIVRCGYLQWN